MKIVYDHQIFSRQKYGGVSRYYSELIKNLDTSYNNINVELPILFSNNEYLKEVDIKTRELPAKNLIPITVARRLRRLFNNVYTNNYLSKHDFDIFHPTYFDPYFLKNLKGKKFVLTVHDMVHEKFPQYSSSLDKTIAWKKELATKAEHVICISENTKKDVIKILKIPEGCISVVHLACSLDVENPKEVTFAKNKQYILFVGVRGGYKNFNLLLEAFSKISEKFPNINVISAGGGRLSKSERRKISSLNLDGRVFQADVSDDELVYLYRNALMFVYPSLYEGFGIPILESMKSGCPVIAGRSSSIPEVSGNAGLLFDPYSVDSLSEKITQLIDNNGLRQDLIKKGIKREKFFSWKKCTEETVKIYERL